MPTPRTDAEALIATLAEQARSAAGENPDPEPEELLDYLAGRLTPEDEQRLDRELLASPAATRALLDLADLEAAGAVAGEARPAELAVRAGWRDLEGRLPGAAVRSRRPPVWLAAIAASLLVTIVGLGSWVWRLQDELRRPVGNVKSLELASGSRAGREPVVALSPGAPFRLVLDPAERCPTYTARIDGPGDRDRRTVEGLEPDERGRLTLLLRGQSGSYRLSLAGCEPRRELEEHQFRITADGG
jgi:hypothetical protein